MASSAFYTLTFSVREAIIVQWWDKPNLGRPTGV